MRKSRQSIAQKIKSKRLVISPFIALIIASATVAGAVVVTNSQNAVSNQLPKTINHASNSFGGLVHSGSDLIAPTPVNNLYDDPFLTPSEIEEFTSRLNTIQTDLNCLNDLSLEATTPNFPAIDVPVVTSLANAPVDFARDLGISAENSAHFFATVNDFLNSELSYTVSGHSLKEGLNFLYTRGGLSNDGFSYAAIIPVYNLRGDNPIYPELDPVQLSISVTGIDSAITHMLALAGKDPTGQDLRNQVNAEKNLFESLHLRATVTTRLYATVHRMVNNLTDFGIDNVAFNNDKFIYELAYESILISGFHVMLLTIRSRADQTIYSEPVAIEVTASLSAAHQGAIQEGVGTVSSALDGGEITAISLGAFGIAAAPIALYKIIKGGGRPAVSTQQETVDYWAESSYADLTEQQVSVEHEVPIADEIPLSKFDFDAPISGSATLTSSPAIRTQLADELVTVIPFQEGEGLISSYSATGIELFTGQTSSFLGREIPTSQLLQGMTQLAQNAEAIQAAGGMSIVQGFDRLPPELQLNTEMLFSSMQRVPPVIEEATSILRRFTGEVSSVASEIVAFERAGLPVAESRALISGLFGRLAAISEEAGIETLATLEIFETGLRGALEMGSDILETIFFHLFP